MATKPPKKTDAATGAENLPVSLQTHLTNVAMPKGFVNPRPLSKTDFQGRLDNLKIKATVAVDQLLQAANRIKIDPPAAPTEEQSASLQALKTESRRIHGTRFALSWFPFPALASPCADKFGYMTPAAVRTASKLPFTLANQNLMGQLGAMMGDPGVQRDNTQPVGNPDANNSTIPAGYTYFGQFVDHDITFDVSSSLSAETDATTVPNMRSPSLDLDSVYGRGPALDPFLYDMPPGGGTDIKMALGSNRPFGPGGPGNGSPPPPPAGMGTPTRFDVPRMTGSNTAVIGDPRNDENLIVSQFHHAMLRFHNAVIDLLVAVGFPGDRFAEAKRIVTHHYQWAVVHDFLKRICGAAAVNAALASVVAPIGSPFSMPVEFSVAAYRFGHSMIRNNYWVNFNFPQATMSQVFQFIRNPLLPVFSNWVVDFNAFFPTGKPFGGLKNAARKIDSFLAPELESLPGFSGMMAVLATRNLRRALALGLPSGQGVAGHFGIAPLTNAQLTQGLPANEVALLNSNGGILLQKTPLWYYVLREAKVTNAGNQLGPVGGRIVAETFVRMLKRDASSFLNVGGGFAPSLPSAVAGDFTVADLVNFAGVTDPI